MMIKGRIATSAIIAVALLSFSARADGISTDPDVFLSSKFTFTDARIAALAGAGCALPGGPLSLYVNAAHPIAYCTQTKMARLMVAGGYGRNDTLFPGAVVPLGASMLIAQDVALAGLYRYLNRSKHQYQHEAVINLSGRLFEKSTDQGAVDIGLNLRYERMAWRRFNYLDSFFISSTSTNSITTSLPWVPDSGDISERRLVADLGFYQSKIAERLDFGLIIQNIMGYTWRQEHPFFNIDTLFANGDTVVRDSSSQDSAWHTLHPADTAFWLSGMYRNIVVGISFSTPLSGDKALLTIPADLSFVGVFDRSIKTRMLLRVGAEARFLEHYALRIGYATAPMIVRINELLSKARSINTNIIAGGGGVNLSPFSFDFYVGKTSWGLSLSIVL